MKRARESHNQGSSSQPLAKKSKSQREKKEKKSVPPITQKQSKADESTEPPSNTDHKLSIRLPKEMVGNFYIHAPFALRFSAKENEDYIRLIMENNISVLKATPNPYKVTIRIADLLIAYYLNMTPREFLNFFDEKIEKNYIDSLTEAKKDEDTLRANREIKINELEKRGSWSISLAKKEGCRACGKEVVCREVCSCLLYYFCSAKCLTSFKKYYRHDCLEKAILTNFSYNLQQEKEGKCGCPVFEED